MPTESEPVRVVEGDCLDVLRSLPDGCVDAVVTDPPYSSGGLYRGDRNDTADRKYTQSEYQGKRPDFGGDSMDQRAWSQWSYWWLAEARRVTAVGGRLMVFCDWRQYPATADALQWAGWLWRGTVVWDKGLGTRAPHRGRFKHQCEYVLWASNGPMANGDDAHFGHLPGCFSVPVRQCDKHHVTGKPTALMRELVTAAPPGSIVLDPFGGSGTTAVAAVAEGRRCLLIEKEPAYVAIARKRVAEATGRAPGSLLTGVA